MSHDTVFSCAELPDAPAPQQELTSCIPPEAEDAALLGRRAFLGIAARSTAIIAVAATGLALSAPQPAHAETPPPPHPPTPKASPTDQELESRTSFEKAYQQQIEEANGWFSKVTDAFGKVVAPLGVLTTAVVAGPKYLQERRKKREADQKEIELREDDSWQATLNKIIDTLTDINTHLQTSGTTDYEALRLTYGKMGTFATHKRFAPEVFDAAVALLQIRAKADRTPEQQERRINADRELYKLLSQSAHLLPRQNDNSEPSLPDASGISLIGMRYLRKPLERLLLEGAHLSGLVITGSLAGSNLKLARLQRTIFGESDAICDLRGTDLSQANLAGAVFAHVLIDGHTQFGAGLRGNPCARFGNITSDTLEPAQIQEKVDAAQVVIKKWQLVRLMVVRRVVDHLAPTITP